MVDKSVKFGGARLNNMYYYFFNLKNNIREVSWKYEKLNLLEI